MADVSFKSNSTVKLDLKTNEVVAQLTAREQKARTLATSQFHRLCEPFVRFDTGIMQKSAKTASDYSKGEIVWNTPYATYAYFNDVNTVNTQHNPNACARWADVAMAKYKSVIQQLIAKTIREG